jgi:Domain of unknown function (DUF4407)
MYANNVTEMHASDSSIGNWLIWVGGGERRELHERHERSAYAVAGVVVLINVVLGWMVTTLAIMQATHRSVLAVVPFTLAFALLVAAISRAIAAGSAGRAPGRGAVAVTVVLILGGVVGEFASLAAFSDSIGRQLQQQAAHDAVSAPAVVQASNDLQRIHDARVALDHGVEIARAHRDEALVVARCEYHPTPACPQTRITGVPGSGPENRTANELLADSQRELDEAVAARDRHAPELDVRITDDERVVAERQRSAVEEADHGVGARWVAMQQLTSANPGFLILRLLIVGFFAVLALLPLILRLWRGETTHDRHAQARAERERADLVADTAIAVKRAEVRAAAEILWAEQQLAQARLVVEAQTEIDRAQLRRRVNAAIEGATRDLAHSTESENLPAVIEPQDAIAAQTISSIPDVTRAAARWIRPLVPGVIARAIDSSTHPLRTARQVIEEVEEITFSLRRIRTVTIHSEESPGTAPTRRTAAFASEYGPDNDPSATIAAAQPLSPRPLSQESADVQSVVSGRGKSRRELTKRDGPAELRSSDSPRQLPPAE